MDDKIHVNVGTLIKHCKDTITCDWKYVYGAKGKILSVKDIQNLQKQYGRDKVPDSDLNKAGKICSDCSGLISSLTKIHRSSQGYYDTALERKEIDKREPTMKGWGVWKNGHIGIYDGNDGYYAMENSEKNACHRNLKKNSFTHIIKLCDIDY